MTLLDDMMWGLSSQVLVPSNNQDMLPTQYKMINFDTDIYLSRLTLEINRSIYMLYTHRTKPSAVCPVPEYEMGLGLRVCKPYKHKTVSKL